VTGTAKLVATPIWLPAIAFGKKTLCLIFIFNLTSNDIHE
jgi:hypothetical protein